MAKRRGQPWNPVGDENTHEVHRDPERADAPGGAPAEFIDTAHDENLPGDRSEPGTNDAHGTRTSSAR